MTREQQKEQFSIAYVRAVAAAARVNVYKFDVDDDSIDIGFATRITSGRPSRPRLEAQLKCSAVIPEKNGVFQYPLLLKNYNDLSGDELIPRVLIVLIVPPKLDDWLTQDADQMIMRKAAFWLDLAGSPESSNKTKVTVAVPKANLFNPNALLKLLKAGTQT